jgi:hypothetical protein
MPLDTVGILTPIDFTLEQPSVISTVIREVFVDETPLVSRLEHNPATSEVFTIDRYDVRQRGYTLGTGGLGTTGATSLPIADASPFQVGDVLEVTDGTNTERLEVLAPPVLTATPNTLTVRRAREGTTAAVFAAGATLRLVGNARTGGEIDQQAFRTVVTPLEQYVQTFQYAVQVGGKAQAIRNVALPPGVADLFGRDRAIKLLEAMRDVENSMYYGLGEKPVATGDRAKMKGLRSLIQSFSGGANVSLTTKTNYTRAQFVLDTFAKIRAAGGDPDVILCSTDAETFIETWVPNKTAQMGQGRTETLGFPITEFILPLQARPITFVESLQLRPGTMAVLTSADLDVRVLRDIFWQPRERRGDAIEGDWIADFAISMGHPQWHAWVEGIQSAA